MPLPFRLPICLTYTSYHTRVRLQHIVKMVYYHTSNIVKPAAYIYVGKDKVESAIPTIPTNLHTLLTA
jgi:hypothetical protein